MAVINVLIVDDISSTLDNLRKLLSFEDDIEVVATATNGREAVEQAKALSPDIVLMDVNMPEMDGIQATEILATEAPGSPVIIMSVQGERDYLRRAMQSGAREFLIKPFSGDELIASIRRVHQLEQRKEVYVRPVAAVGAVPAGPAPAGVPGGEHRAPAPLAEAPAAEAPQPPVAPDVVAAPEPEPLLQAETAAPAVAVSEAEPVQAGAAVATEAVVNAAVEAPPPTTRRHRARGRRSCDGGGGTRGRRRGGRGGGGRPAAPAASPEEHLR